jgi:heme-degrading monooxygenase HmoA
MYVSLTRVKTSDQPIENATIVAEEMLRWFREMEGFEGLLMLSKEGTTLGLTFWESREVAERYRVSRMQFRDRMTSAANVEVEETVDYEVMFAHLGPSLAAFGA